MDVFFVIIRVATIEHRCVTHLCGSNAILQSVAPKFNAIVFIASNL